MKDLGREVDDFEVFERMHKRRQGTGEFGDNKSARVSVSKFNRFYIYLFLYLINNIKVTIVHCKSE